jgi:hypothetical protein
VANTAEHMAAISAKGVAARQKKRAEENARLASGAAEAVDPWKVLEAVAYDKKVSPGHRVNAAKALQERPAPESAAEWRSSVQVQPGYTIPTWPEVLDFAKFIGAY